MKNRLLTMITLMFCIGLLIPKAVFAESKSYQYVDYRFTIQDEDGESIEGLTFNLYDESGLFHFESKYNEEEKYYYFDDYIETQDISSAFPSELIDFYIPNKGTENKCEIYNQTFERIINESSKFNIGCKECNHFPSLYNYPPDSFSFFYSSNSTLPMILESDDHNIKIIVFVSLHYLYRYNKYQSPTVIVPYNFLKFIIVNNDDFSTNCTYSQGWNYPQCDFYEQSEENARDTIISFMRNAVYEYNDELWEELNNGPIASSEMSFDNSSVVIDSSDSGANNISTPSIIQLNNKADTSTNNSNNEDNNIINVITNPQTGIKGLLILVLSLIIIIGSCFIIIKKKNKHIVN